MNRNPENTSQSARTDKPFFSTDVGRSDAASNLIALAAARRPDAVCEPRGEDDHSAEDECSPTHGTTIIVDNDAKSIVKKKADQVLTPTKKQPPKKRTWRKPKGKPKRPLSAYNFFFQKERMEMLGDMREEEESGPSSESISLRAQKRRHRKSHGIVGFAEMAKVIAAKWKTLDEAERKEFEEASEIEKTRYKTELAVWKEDQAKKRRIEIEAEAVAAVQEQANVREQQLMKQQDTYYKEQQQVAASRMSNSNHPIHPKPLLPRQVPQLRPLTGARLPLGHPQFHPKSISAVLKGGEGGARQDLEAAKPGNHRTFCDAAHTASDSSVPAHLRQVYMHHLTQQMLDERGLQPPGVLDRARAALLLPARFGERGYQALVPNLRQGFPGAALEPIGMNRLRELARYSMIIGQQRPGGIPSDAEILDVLYSPR